MKLTVLTENVAGGTFLAEHGLSYLIEADGEKILFDTGHSDVFLKNAEKLHINISSEVDKVVLSHGHWDHGNGLRHLKNKKLITHPKSFTKRFRKKDNSYIGLDLSLNDVAHTFNLQLSTKPLQLSESIYYLGEIPRQNDFEAKSTPFHDENKTDDFVPDDSALAIKVDGSVVVVAGCSHSGICNIVSYAKEITNCSKVLAVIGGFHLQKNDTILYNTIRFFKEMKNIRLYPSHCTELPALVEFYKEFGIHALKTGSLLFF